MKGRWRLGLGQRLVGEVDEEGCSSLGEHGNDEIVVISSDEDGDELAVQDSSKSLACLGSDIPVDLTKKGKGKQPATAAVNITVKEADAA